MKELSNQGAQENGGKRIILHSEGNFPWDEKKNWGKNKKWIFYFSPCFLRDKGKDFFAIFK